MRRLEGGGRVAGRRRVMGGAGAGGRVCSACIKHWACSIVLTAEHIERVCNLRNRVPTEL